MTRRLDGTWRVAAIDPAYDRKACGYYAPPPPFDWPALNALVRENEDNDRYCRHCGCEIRSGFYCGTCAPVVQHERRLKRRERRRQFRTRRQVAYVCAS
jgi:hypothetical protein